MLLTLSTCVAELTREIVQELLHTACMHVGHEPVRISPAVLLEFARLVRAHGQSKHPALDFVSKDIIGESD